MDATLALSRVFGMYVYFLLGYYANQINIQKLMRIPWQFCALIFLIELCTLFILFDRFDVSASRVFSVFVHGLHISKDIVQIPLVIGTYIASFLLAVFNFILFINIFFREVKLFDNVGKDTMPIYLMHLPLVNIYAAIMTQFSYMTYIVVAIPIMALLIAGLSSEAFRKRFNDFFDWIERVCLAPINANSSNQS